MVAAVERREGARPYVTGARSTSQGVPVLPRFPLAQSDAVGREGSGGAPGCGVPHQRPRGAPFPRRPEGPEGRTRSPARTGRAAMPSAAKPPKRPSGQAERRLFEIVNQMATAPATVRRAAAGVRGAGALPCLRVRLKTFSRITELSQHDADGGEFQECEGVAIEIFPVLGEAAATVEPRNRAFDDPTLG
jgi:hypothetical protein